MTLITRMGEGIAESDDDRREQAILIIDQPLHGME